MAVLPTRILEIEFTAGTWTDVTADLVSFSTRRGRNRESGAFETGTLTFTLRNDTRKYDPDHASGTYYGRLRPNRRVRLRATSTLTFPVFQGYIDRISQMSGGPNDAVALFTCSDFFKLLNRVELPSSVYLTTVATDAPELWFHFDEPLGSSTAINSGSLGRAYDGTWQVVPGFGPPGLGDAGLVVRDPGTAVRGVAFGNYAVNELPQAYGVDSTRPFAIEAWVRMNAVATGGVNIYLQPGPGASGESVKVQWPADNRPGFVIYNTAGTVYAVRTASALATGTTYHIVARHDSDRTMHIFVDGVDVTVADLGVPGTTTGTIAKTPGPAWFPQAGAVTGDDVTIDEAAIYTTAGSIALTNTQIATHNTVGRTPWNGDLSGTRLGRILDLAGVPAGDRAIDAGNTTLQSASLGTTALAYAQKIEETELGWLFVTRDGKVKFVARQNGYLGTYLTPQFTLADDKSGVTFPPGVPYRSADADVDESTIVTRATVSRDGSVAITVYDSAAQAEFGWLDETHDGLLHNSETHSKAYAEWIVSTHKTPSSRVGTVTLTPAKDPANLWPVVLGLELVERVTYKRKAQNVGAVTTIDMRVEAISHELAGQRWTVKLQLSPFYLAGGVQTGVWDTSLWDQAVWGF